MKYKAQIMGVVVLVAVFGVLLGVWQFYFKEIFEGYKQDDRLRDSLEKTLNQLKEDFQGYKPELLIEEWRSKVQPWRDAREERGRFFNFGDWYQIELVRQESRMLKFWYTDELNKRMSDLYMRITSRIGNFPISQDELRRKLDVSDKAEDITWDQVEVNFRKLNFGTRLINWLMDSNVTSIKDIVIWPRRIPENYADMIAVQSVGLHITMTTKDFVKMMDGLRQETRYFTVDNIRISYPYIAWQVEPQLDIELIVSQANYRRPPDPQEPTVSPAARAQAQPEGVSMERRRRREEIEETAGQKIWRWFRQNILYMP